MEWYKSKKGWTAAVIASFTLISQYIFEPWEWGHAAVSIYETIRRNFHYITPWIAPAFFLLAIYFFERDRRGPKTYDPHSLKGRTLKLRDDIQEFFDAAPAAPGKQAKNESKDQYLTRLLPALSRRVDYLINGYAWRFHDRALAIHYQFGERGLLDAQLGQFLSRPHKNEECYQEILAGLTRLSEHPESATGVSDSGYSEMAFQDYRDGKNRGAF
jgi:hypothetical protein